MYDVKYKVSLRGIEKCKYNVSKISFLLVFVIICLVLYRFREFWQHCCRGSILSNGDLLVARMNSLSLYNQNFPKPTAHIPPGTFKALKLRLWNSSTFKDFQGRLCNRIYMYLKTSSLPRHWQLFRENSYFIYLCRPNHGLISL